MCDCLIIEYPVGTLYTVQTSAGGERVEWTNGPMDQWTNGPMRGSMNGSMDQSETKRRVLKAAAAAAAAAATYGWRLVTATYMITAGWGWGGVSGDERLCTRGGREVWVEDKYSGRPRRGNALGEELTVSPSGEGRLFTHTHTHTHNNTFSRSTQSFDRGKCVLLIGCV